MLDKPTCIGDNRVVVPLNQFALLLLYIRFTSCADCGQKQLQINVCIACESLNFGVSNWPAKSNIFGASSIDGLIMNVALSKSALKEISGACPIDSLIFVDAEPQLG